MVLFDNKGKLEEGKGRLLRLSRIRRAKDCIKIDKACIKDVNLLHPKGVKLLELIDEFEGNEIEAKMSFSPPDPQVFIKFAKQELENDNLIFKTITGKKRIFHWLYYFDRYGVREGDKFFESYSLIYNPRKQKFWIKSKSLPDSDSFHVYLKRKESIVRIERKITNEDKNLILKIKTEEIGREPIFLGTIKRNKVYLLLQNSRSGRYYSLSADKCCYRHFILSQVEIEYKGVERAKKTEILPTELLTLVGEEIQTLVDFLIKTLGEKFSLQKTKKTKFDWLCYLVQGESK